MKVTYVPLPLALFVCAAVLIASSSPVISVQAQTAGAPGGFVEPTSTQTTRPRLSASQIAGFMPARGIFSFPAPYNTQGVRLTNGSDCGGSDCVLPIGYSYWRRINNHAGSSTLYAVLTLDRNRGGGGPTLFAYNKSTGNTVKVGPLFDASSGMSWAHGEMFYFSATRPTAYYIHEGPRLMRYDILSRATEVVADVSGEFGSDKYIWQPSSSDDDRVHAFTLRRDGDWATVGCVVYDEGSRAYRFFGQAYELDECQIDRSGRFLVIKDQVDGADGEDNVIVDLATGAQRVLLDPQGAGGHSDLGHGYMVAEDNWNQLPGSARLWRLDQDPSAPGNGRLVFHATDWNWGMNHITHTNARAGVAPEQQMACSSETTRMSIPHGNELICYKLDGSLQVLVVAPVMTDLDASGGGDDYYKAPKANLDVTGDFMIWTSNMGGDRLDAFIVRVPKELLGLSSSSPSPSPTPSPTTGCTTPRPAANWICDAKTGNWLPRGWGGIRP